MTSKLPTFGIDTVDRKAPIEKRKINDVKDYHVAISKEAHLTRARKAQLLASPQISHGDRGPISPIGGQVW
jgi:hypothetical protein